MLTSNSVSTIFKCMTCSFGTCDQTAYAEHIKHCSSESTSEVVLDTAAGDEVQNNSSKTVENRYVCKQCLLPTDCSRSLLLHLQDVHKEDFQIFLCKFCSTYAARRKNIVKRHAVRKHPGRVLKGRTTYAKLYQPTVMEQISAENETSAGEHGFAKVQATSCDQSESSIPQTVKSSKSLGLQFLGKQLPAIGCDEYICQLCSFSHVASHFVVKHIWKDHRDKFSEVPVAKASTRRVTEDASVTEILYKCDDCSYSTYAKRNFYDHCAHHQFEGSSKCPHCSYSALTDTAIIKHTQTYHNAGDISAATLGDHQPKSICTKISSTSCKVAKRSGKSRKKVYAHRHRNKTWFTCPYCTYKAKWRSSVWRHKAHVHAELSKACGKKSSAVSASPSHKLEKADGTDAVKINSNCMRAEQQEIPDNILGAKKQNVYTCDICSAKLKSLRCWKMHKQMHTDLRRYKCPLCGSRSNYLHNMRKHIQSVHGNAKTRAIILSVEDAKQTIEAYRKTHTHAELGKSRRKRLSTDSTSPSHKLRKMDAGDTAAEHSYSCNRDKQQKLPSDDLPAATKQNVFKCQICSADCKTMKCWYVHRQLHLDLRRYQCPHCGLRSNYLSSVRSHIHTVHKDKKEQADVVRLSKEDAEQTITAYKKCPYIYLDLRPFQCPHCGLRSNYLGNMKKHISVVHKDEKAQAIELSLRDAQQSIEAYRKQTLKPSPTQEKRVHPSATVRRNKLLHSASYRRYKSLLAPSSRILTSSEHSSMQVKQQKMDFSDASHSAIGNDVQSLMKRYMCSVCKMQSSHKSSVYRHICNVHNNARAKVIVVKRKMSDLAVERKTSKSEKLNAETPDNCSKSYDQDVDQKGQHTVINKEHDYSSGAESGTQKTVKSEVPDTGVCETDDNSMQAAEVTGVRSRAPAQPSVQYKARKAYSCDICPYSATNFAAVLAHKKLHVKRPGYSYECSVCPYFACQASHRERHMLLHSSESTAVDEKPDQTTNFRFGVHLCEHCPYMSSHKKALLFHRQLHRPRASALYKCDQCPFYVTEPHHLFTHTKLHTAEYMQKRLKYGQLPQVKSDSLDDRSKRVLSTSGNSKELDGLPVQNASTPDEDKLDEMTRNKSVDDGDSATGVVSESVASVTEENSDVSAHSNSAATGRHLTSWCCERCPYSTSKLACFKRHVWLHGKQYPYVCRYCDYSVQSYWQLVSHTLWHFAPNKHLVYAQSVSNLDSLPSQLPNRDSIPDSLASVNRFIPSFENSDAFRLSELANFQCDHCPFVTEQRSEFFSHMLCHSASTTAANRCPYCTFHTDLPGRLSTHVYLHFNLPGCRQSYLPPNVCHSEDWNQLDAAIDAVAKRSTCSVESHCSNWSCDQEGDPSVRLVRNEDDSMSALSAVPHSAVSDVHSVSDDEQHADVTASTVSLVEEPCSADSVTSKVKCCQYCYKVIDDPDALVKHEAGHLVGFVQPAP